MTNDKPVAEELAKALAETNKAPEPSLWVRIVQMVFAGFCLAGGVAVALILLLQGPPAPKEPEASKPEAPKEAQEGDKTAAARLGFVTVPVVATEPGAGEEGGSAGESESGEGSGGEEKEEGEEEDGKEEDEKEGEEEGASEGSGSTTDSLANLNEQAPWAFAIVALLVGAFIATGKSLNFNGSKQE